MNRCSGVVVFVLFLTVAADCGGSSGSSDSNDAGHPTPGAGAVVTAVKLTDSGCDPENFSLPAGSLVFSVTNSGTTKVKEMEIQNAGGGRVLGDIEGVEPGQTKSFVVDLPAGTYIVKCPEDASHAGTLTVK
jgi:iron uptake system component EfeO